MKYLVILGIVSLFILAACAKDVEVEEEAPAVEVPVQEEVEPVVAPDVVTEVRIAGDSVIPLVVTIEAGGSVTWNSELSKATSLVIWKEGKFFMNSPIMNPGEKWEQAFEEAGEYEYWPLAFGPQGAKVVVE